MCSPYPSPITIVQQPLVCAKLLDGAKMDKLLAKDLAFEGLRAQLADVWAGHREHPHKVFELIIYCLSC